MLNREFENFDATVRKVLSVSADCEVVNAVVWIREVNDCFLKALRFFHSLALHKQNYRLNQWTSQVNYCP